MPARTTGSTLRSPWIALAVGCLVGCSQQNSTEYQPLDKAALRSETPAAETPEPARLPATPENAAMEVEEPQGEFEVSTGSTAAEEIPASALAPVNVIDGASIASLLSVGGAGKPTPAAPVLPVAATTLHKVELLIPDKSFQRDAKSKALRVSYDDIDLLKILNMEPVTADAVDQMPAWLTGLNGQQIKIRGFMYPTFQAEGIDRFVLARDNQICCFGRDPKIYDLIAVELAAGQVTDYIPPTRSFDVIGRFRIEIASEDGKPYALYFLDDARIIDR